MSTTNLNSVGKCPRSDSATSGATKLPRSVQQPGESGKHGFHLRHLTGMAFVVEKDVVASPLNLGFLGRVSKVLVAHGISELIAELGRLGRVHGAA